MMIQALIISIFILCVVVAVSVYYSKAGFFLKMLAMPTLLAFCYMATTMILFMVGAPINNYPEGKWEYVSHVAADSGAAIVLWAVPERYNDFRLYKFPYTRENQKKLNEASEDQKKGDRIQGKFTKNFDGTVKIDIVKNPKIQGSIPDKEAIN